MTEPEIKVLGHLRANASKSFCHGSVPSMQAFKKWWKPVSYHKWVSTGLQRAETDAKQHDRRERVVVDEPSAVGITVPPIQRQVNVGVAREKHRAKINLQSYGLHSTIHADVPLSCWERLK